MYHTFLQKLLTFLIVLKFIINQAFAYPAIVQNIGEYYYPKNIEQNNDARHKSSIFGTGTALGKLLYAVDHNLLSSNDIAVFLDFDSTIIITKKEETPHKAIYDGKPRGAEYQKKLPKNLHNIQNMLFALEALNKRNIAWAIITARPELNNGHGAGKIKQELVNAGIKRHQLKDFLSPAFYNYQVNIDKELQDKFEGYKYNPESRSQLWKKGDIQEFKLSNDTHPAQEGNIILMAHMPKSWGIYYFLQQLSKHRHKSPKFVVFIDDSPENIIQMKDSINKTKNILNKEYSVLDIAPLKGFADHTQFILVHYARTDDHILPQDFFTPDKVFFQSLCQNSKLLCNQKS